jgi:hypothetical protein
MRWRAFSDNPEIPDDLSILTKVTADIYETALINGKNQNRY